MAKNIGLSINIRKFEKGKCFLCGSECEEYCHSYCAISYFDEKEKRLREAKDLHNI